MKIIWDEPKRKATLASRGLDFKMVTIDFFAHARIETARQDRFLALGLIEDRAYAVVFKPLGTEAISLISVRRASAREKRTL